MNELVLNRRSGGLFAAGEQSSGPEAPGAAGPAGAAPAPPRAAAPRRKGGARLQWLSACERAHRSRSRIDHAQGLALARFVVERAHGQRERPSTAAGYPRATSRGRRVRPGQNGPADN